MIYNSLQGINYDWFCHLATFYVPSSLMYSLLHNNYYVYYLTTGYLTIADYSHIVFAMIVVTAVQYWYSQCYVDKYKQLTIQLAI